LAIDIFGYFYIITFMLYILHHSKGALMLSAQDRDQVLKWSRRQLGSKAGFVSITDGISRDAMNSVEKDGTGIGTDNGCHPVMAIMANLAQDVPMEHGSSESHDVPLPEFRTGIKKPTWH
jgi:hypothetical protein